MFDKWIKWLFVGILIFGVIGCSKGGGNNSPLNEENNSIISGYVIDDVLVGANITIFSLDGNILESNITSDSNGYYEVSVSNVSDGYIVSSIGGRINGETFNGTMSAICLIDTIKSCNITPHTTLIKELSNQYSGNIISRLEKSSIDINNILGVQEDPFIAEYKGNSPSNINLSILREELANGVELSNIITIIKSDLHDGYIDESSLKSIFLKAKLRVDTTITKDTLSIASDKSNILPENTKITRNLYSISKNEIGDSVVSGEYLSDIAYVEKQDFSEITEDDNITVERIIYQSFNIGKWKKELNAQTTILSKIFMTAPTLLFIPNSEKEVIADILVKDDLFVQAISEYSKIIENNLDSSPLFDNLIVGLANIGRENISDIQLENSNSIISFKTSSYSKNLRQKLIEKDDIFKAFDGMWIGYDPTNKNLNLLSRSSLWYGLQSIESYGKGFWNDLGTVSLISPKMGFVTVDDVKPISNIESPIFGAVETKIGLGDIDSSLENLNSSQSVILYRNNPDSWTDLPQVMNTMSIIQLVSETLLGKSPFGSEKVKKTLTSLKNATPSKETIKFVWTVLKASVVANNLICEVSNQSHGLSCAKSGNIETLLNTFEEMVTIPDENGDFKDITNLEYIKITAQIGAYLATAGKANVGNFSNQEVVALLLTNMIIMPLATSAESSTITASKAYKFSLNLIKGDMDKTNSDYKSIMALLSDSISNPQLLDRLSNIVDKAKGLMSFTINTSKLKDSIEKMTSNEMVSLIVKKTLKDTADNILASGITTLIKTLTPAKYLDIIMGANKGGAMAYDWMTDPSIVKMDIKTSEDNKSINIDYSIPQMKAIRYLKVPKNDNFMVLSSTPKEKKEPSSLSYKDNYLYTLGSNREDNHFLVMNGFKSMLENQAVYHDNDSDTINQLLDAKNITISWHERKFDSIDTIEPINREDRLECKSAYNGECIPQSILENTLLWNTDALKWADEDNPLLQKIVGNKDVLDSYNIIDFSEHLKNKLDITGDYPLIHNTNGIFSDYTEIDIRTDLNFKIFMNTVNFYVLPDFTEKETNLQVESSFATSLGSISSEGSDKQYELQLKFASSNYKENEDKLYMVYRYVIDGKVSYSNIVDLGKVTWNNKIVAFPFNKTLDASNIDIIIFNDTLKAYAQQSGDGLFKTIRVASNYNTISSNKQKSIIVLKTSEMKQTDIFILSRQEDSDKDGISDELDAFPLNANYQYDTDEDGMPDKWENLYNLNPLIDTDAIEDPDKDEWSNLDEFKLGTNPNEDDRYTDIDGDGVSNYQEFIDNTIITDKSSYHSLDLKVEATRGEATLNWNIITNADTYDICIAKEPIANKSCSLLDGGRKFSIFDKDTTSKVIDSLSLATTYYIKIYALVDSIKVHSSKELEINMEDMPIIASPNNLKATSTSDIITLNWDSVDEAIAYKVCMAKEPIIDGDKCVDYNGGQIFGETSTEHIIANFELDTKYYFRVKGFREGYLSNWSDEINIQENTTVQPTDISNLNNKTLIEPTGWNAEIKIDTLAENQKSATIDFGICGGDLTYLSIDDGGYLFDETITYGSCIAGCQVWIKLDGTEYKEICPNETPHIGTLEEKVAGDTPTDANKLKWDNIASEKMLYEDAVKYCDNKGARLPTIDELRAVTINCGGVYNSFFDKFYFEDSVLEDGLYKFCYNKQGFGEEKYYSSTPSINEHLLFSFTDTTTYYPYTSKAYSVRCIYGEVDTTSPVITLNGSNVVVMNTGDEYHELGASTDDGSDVIITGKVDIYHEGNYTLTYNATDYMQNKAISKSRTVIVKLYYHDGDSFETAHILKDNTTRESSLLYGEDVEYFKLILSKSSDMNISVKNAENNYLNIQLYDNNKKEFCSYGCGKDVNKFLDEGVYYISVTSSEEVIDYTLTNSVIPSTTFTRNSQLGIVKNLTTGLQWEDGTPEYTYSWEVGGYAVVEYGTLEEVINYCNNLDLNGNGWRVPTLEELESILNNGNIDRAFRHTTSNIYWSSTEIEEDGYKFYGGIDFKTGTKYALDKREIDPDGFSVFFASSNYIRCVK